MSASGQPPFVDPGHPPAVAATLDAEFGTRVGGSPTLVGCAPGRVNLIGEHLDYNAGRCLPFALPHSTYAAVRPRTDGMLAVASLQTASTATIAPEDVRPGSVEGWPAYLAGVVWALREEGWDVPGLDVLVDSRVPLGSGLSSSAALECALAIALVELTGAEDNQDVRRTLVSACVRAESEFVGAPTGGMDQSVSLLATADHALLLDFAEDTAEQVPWAPAEDDLALLVIDTRVSHSHSSGGYGSRRAESEQAAAALGVAMLREAQGDPGALDRLGDPLLRKRARHVLTEMDRVDAAVSALAAGDHAALGPLLDASHDSLRDDYEVSCDELDVVVSTSRDHGALGARMTGGGFGGSAVALVPHERLAELTTAVAEAFSARGWDEPGFLRAPAGPPARVLR